MSKHSLAREEAIFSPIDEAIDVTGQSVLSLQVVRSNLNLGGGYEVERVDEREQREDLIHIDLHTASPIGTSAGPFSAFLRS